MSEIEGILKDAGEQYVKDIRANLSSTGTDATGETSASVGFEVKKEGSRYVLEVYGGRPYFPTVETGSKPSNKKPGRKMIESLTKWKAVRGLLASPWAIATNILKFGSRLWQKGGRRDIYTNVAEKSMMELPRIIAEAENEKLKKSVNAG